PDEPASADPGPAAEKADAKPIAEPEVVEAPEETPAITGLKPAGPVEPDGPAAAETKTGMSVLVCPTKAKLEQTSGSKLRTITFDDIETESLGFVGFKANRYAASHGIIITGKDGQYADDTFGWDEKLNAVSPPSMYAPGPRSVRPDTGGNSTVVTFTAGGKPAATSAFGVYLIDADHPEQGQSSVTIHGKDGKVLAKKNVTGGNEQQVFTGFVTRGNTGMPVAAIYSVTIINGSGWVGGKETEVVLIDDMVFSPPGPE
ncbi:hypothetical protein ACFL4W_02710, partial [Planctomycetota bacterium]